MLSKMRGNKYGWAPQEMEGGGEKKIRKEMSEVKKKHDQGAMIMTETNQIRDTLLKAQEECNAIKEER